MKRQKEEKKNRQISYLPRKIEKFFKGPPNKVEKRVKIGASHLVVTNLDGDSGRISE